MKLHLFKTIFKVLIAKLDPLCSHDRIGQKPKN